MKGVLLLLTTMAFGDQYDRFLGPAPIRQLIMLECAEMGVPVHIAAGLLWSESGGHQYEVSGTSKGYWQLNALFHDDFSARFYGGRPFDEFDPVASTAIALRYLAWLHEQEGTWWEAILSYKTGQNGKRPASKAIVKLCHDIAKGKL